MILKIMIRRIVGWNFIIVFKYIVAVPLHQLISTHGAFFGFIHDKYTIYKERCDCYAYPK